MASDDVVLVATDVAARGIDIKNVKYVVHYQIPKSTDTYVHRCVSYIVVFVTQPVTQ